MKKYVLSAIGILLLVLSCIPSSASESRVVRVGAFNYFPAVFKDTDGVVKGFYVDALSDLGRRENIRFEYVYGSWSDGLERIKSGEVDVLTSVAYTPERAEYMDYSQTPLLTVWVELFATQSSDIHGIRGVEGKKIAVVKGDLNGQTFINRVHKFGINCKIVEMDGFELIFKAVAEHKVDAGVVSNTFGAAKQRQYGLRSTGVVFNPFDIFVTVAKGKNQDLLQLFDRYLNLWQHQPNSVFNRARQKWSQGSVGTISYVPRWLGYASAALGSFAVIAMIFIVMLRRQVRRATADIMQNKAVLRDNEAKFRSYVDNAPDGVFVADENGRYIDVNPAATALTGYSREELLEMSVSDLVHPDSLEISRDHFQTLKDTGAASSEFEFLHKSGIRSWWSVDAVKLSETRCLGFARDISDRKQVENELRTIALKYQQLFQSMQNGFALHEIICDEHGVPCDYRFIEINQAFENLTGLKAESVVGRTVLEVLPDLDKFWIETYGRVALTGESTHFENYAEDLRRYYEIKAYSPQTRIFATIISDITDRKQVEKELQDKNRELESFTYTVSHDLKSPLITIQFFSGQIMQDLNAGRHDNYLDDLRMITDAAAKMTSLLDDLLELSRIGRIMNTASPVDMNGLVKDVLAQLAGTIRGRQVEIVVQSELPAVHGDHQRIATLVQNLMENALRYMGNQAAPRIEFGSRPQGTESVFFVSDNGIGIDPCFHENIFGLFNKLDAKSEGTGIGLAMARRIVEVHGGRIWVESEGKGSGSVFCFTLPSGVP